MSDNTTDETAVEDETEDETPVYVEINHRGGRASLAVVHIDGQQVFDVTSVNIELDPADKNAVVVTVTHSGGETTTAEVTKLDLLGEVLA